MRARAKRFSVLRSVPAVILVSVLMPAGLRVAWTHPHLTPEQIRARIQELDALIPVVKQKQLDLFLERASLNTRLDRLVEGLLDCRTAALRFPGSPRPHVQAGEILEVRGAFDTAAASYEMSLSLTRPHERTYWRLGTCYRELKLFDRAEAAFRKSAELAKDNLVKAARFVDAARAAEAGGDFATAEKAYDRSVRLSKGWPAYVEARAELYMRHRKFDRAARDFTTIVSRATSGEEEFPMMVRHGDALAAAGSAAEAKTAYEKAEKTISRLLDYDPAFVEYLHYWRGRARLALGKTEEAKRDAGQALEGLPDQTEYLELMVNIGKVAGETRETRKAARGLKTNQEFEAKSRKRFLEIQAEVRDRVKKALEHVTVEAIFIACLEKGEALKARGVAAGQKALTLAGRRLEKLRKAMSDRVGVYDYYQARLDLAGGRSEAALRSIERSLKKHKDDPRFRRIRMQAAGNLDQTAVVEKDRKFLEALITQSQDQDLLEPPTSGKGKKGKTR